jgi:O-antigen ligase
VKDEKWLKRITWVFLILGAFFLLCRLVLPWASFLQQILPNGAGGSLLYVWMAALILSLILFNKELSSFVRIVLIAFLFVFLYATVIYTFDWKSGWIPPMAALMVIFLLRYPRSAIVLGIIGLLLLPTIFSNLISTDEYSYSTRLVAWEIILKEIVRANPILGLGPANYYYYTPLYPILGYSVQFNSHNNYIDILAQSGIIGLVCFFWFAVELAFLGFRLLKKELSSFARAYVIAVIGGLAGTLTAGMLGDWILPFVYNIGLRGFRTSVIGWMLMAGLVVIEQIYLENNKTTTS